MSPTIYGVGSGGFNKLSIQVPRMMRAAIKDGFVGVLGEGTGVWDYVHILDLARLYEILLLRVLKGEEIPYGEKGILFSGTGRFEWAELSRGIAGALKELGVLETDEVKRLKVKEAADRWAGGMELLVELGWGSK
jgi:nucleoside-diphosphate-sugar epimerase